jgi:hypothetical protein
MFYFKEPPTTIGLYGLGFCRKGLVDPSSLVKNRAAIR